VEDAADAIGGFALSEPEAFAIEKYGRWSTHTDRQDAAAWRARRAHRDFELRGASGIGRATASLLAEARRKCRRPDLNVRRRPGMLPPSWLAPHGRASRRFAVEVGCHRTRSRSGHAGATFSKSGP